MKDKDRQELFKKIFANGDKEKETTLEMGNITEMLISMMAKAGDKDAQVMDALNKAFDEINLVHIAAARHVFKNDEDKEKVIDYANQIMLETKNFIEEMNIENLLEESEEK